MSNTTIEKIVIILVISLIIIGGYISVKSNQTLNMFEEMYYDAPTIETEDIA
ncbi:hypothetical protein N9I83_01045 [bacterium]|nr:hypothetical protein [bacterium]